MFKLKPILVFTQKFHEEGPEGVKWELGLAGFTLGKWGSSHTGTGIWSLGMGKKWEWEKNGNGIRELRSGIWKKK